MLSSESGVGGIFVAGDFLQLTWVLNGMTEVRECLKRQIDPEGLSQGADLLLRWAIKHQMEVMPS